MKKVHVVRLTFDQRATMLTALTDALFTARERDREIVRQVHDEGLDGVEASTTREIHRTQIADIESAVKALQEATTHE